MLFFIYNNYYGKLYWFLYWKPMNNFKDMMKAVLDIGERGQSKHMQVHLV